MKINILPKISFLLVISSFSLVHAMDSLEDRICANLKQGAFGKTGAIRLNEMTCGKKDPIAVPVTELTGKSDDQARSQLKTMGVEYLFNFNNADLTRPSGQKKYFIKDFMHNAVAESQTENFSAQSCLIKDGTQSESFARFDRFSENDSMGGYLLVQENDSTVTNLKSNEAFTIGTWVKIKTDYHAKTADGYFPIFSKTALNTKTQAGQTEWEFKLTSEVAYLNINRNGQFQNNLNRQLPWWADRFGSCYENNISRECWHFVAISVNPAEHKYSVMMLRKFADELPGNNVEFFENYETSISQDNVPIVASTKTALRIGGSNTNTMDGMLKGTFFAKRALSQDEMRAIATYTTPAKEASLTCAPAK
ncbi:MAG: hypothetical protein WA160_16640 [Pseudobdellovibrio sp.]